MLEDFDKYFTMYKKTFDDFIGYFLNEQNDYNDYKYHAAAYVIQTQYRKYIIRKYLNLQKRNDSTWHMNMLN